MPRMYRELRYSCQLIGSLRRRVARINVPLFARNDWGRGLGWRTIRLAPSGPDISLTSGDIRGSTKLQAHVMNRSMMRGSGSVNYLALLLVIILGVTAGNLLSGWISVQLASYLGKQTMADFSKSARGSEGSGTLSFPTPGDLIQRQQEQAREQRRRDRDGVRLGQACEEWRRADAQLKTDTTAAEARKHCGLYERYVKDGILPGKR